MRHFLGLLAVLCPLVAVSSATPITIYSDHNNGTTTSVLSAADAGGFLSGGWIFDDVLPIAGYVGQPVWGSTISVRNTNANPVTLSLLAGFWAADGANGGPGTRLDIASTVPISVPVGDVGLIIYSNWTLPAGKFWIGYALSTYGISGTTAADLDGVHFLMANPVADVGTATDGFYTSTGLTIPGNNPGVGALQAGNTAQRIQFWQDDAAVPEPGTTSLALGGLLILAGLGLRRK